MLDRQLVFKIEDLDSSLRNSNNEFLSLNEYESLARQYIRWYCSKKKLKSNYLINNEEIFSYIVYQLMTGDWKYDPTKKASILTYRMNCVKWAITTIFSKMVENRKHHPKFVHISALNKGYKKVELKLAQLKPDETPDEVERTAEIRANIQKLQPRAKRIFNQVLEGKTHKQIAKAENVHLSSVYNTISRNIEKVRQTS